MRGEWGRRPLLSILFVRCSPVVLGKVGSQFGELPTENVQRVDQLLKTVGCVHYRKVMLSGA